MSSATLKGKKVSLNNRSMLIFLLYTKLQRLQNITLKYSAAIQCLVFPEVQGHVLERFKLPVAEQLYGDPSLIFQQNMAPAHIISKSPLFVLFYVIFHNRIWVFH